MIDHAMMAAMSDEMMKISTVRGALAKVPGAVRGGVQAIGRAAESIGGRVGKAFGLSKGPISRTPITGISAGPYRTPAMTAPHATVPPGGPQRAAGRLAPQVTPRTPAAPSRDVTPFSTDMTPSGPWHETTAAGREAIQPPGLRFSNEVVPSGAPVRQPREFIPGTNMRSFASNLPPR